MFESISVQLLRYFYSNTMQTHFRKKLEKINENENGRNRGKLMQWSSFSVLNFGVVKFNTWLISIWEENKCCYKMSKCTKWHLFHSKWSFWVKMVVIFSVTQLVTTVILFSVWDSKSSVKCQMDNSQNSRQKMRTLIMNHCFWTVLFK